MNNKEIALELVKLVSAHMPEAVKRDNEIKQDSSGEQSNKYYPPDKLMPFLTNLFLSSLTILELKEAEAKANKENRF